MFVKKTGALLCAMAFAFHLSGMENPRTVTRWRFRDTPQSFRTGPFPRALAVADFNGDAIPDLVTANRSAATASILLGQGDGTFAPAQDVAAGRGPSAVGVGDFNGDGIADLAITNEGYPEPDAAVSILLGRGDGTFNPLRAYPVGNSPSAVAIGDLNGDGHLDLAVTNRERSPMPGTVSVLLGNGDGTFQAAQNFSVGINPSSVVLADFDGDQILDLAVTNQGFDAAPSQTVSLLLGQGDGTFRTAQNYTAGPRPLTAVVGDFNGDRIPDLAVALDRSNRLAILLGQTDGTLGSARPLYLPTSSQIEALTVGDLNGDGRADLAVMTSNPSAMFIQLGLGDGTFRSLDSVPLGPYPLAVVIDDFDQDGRADVAIAHYGDATTSGGVAILPGKGDGTFLLPSQLMAGENPVDVKIGDVNGDFILDLILLNMGVGGPRAAVTNGSVSVLLGNRDGTFQPPHNLVIGRQPSSLTLADLNGDSKLDLIITYLNAELVAIFLGQGDGTFQPPRYAAVERDPQAVAVADFDNDGFPDLAVINRESNSVSVLLGLGDGRFRPPRHFITGLGPEAIVVGDFNEDGALDLAVVGAISGNVSILLGQGDGTFTRARYFPVRRSPSAIVVADFDGDGHLDLLVAHYEGLSLLRGNGDGTFPPDQLLGPAYNVTGLAVADFDGDSLPDLAMSLPGLNSISLWPGTGDTRLFESPRNFLAGLYPHRLAMGDINGDGRPDLVLTHGIFNRITLLLNETDAPSARRYRSLGKR